MNDNELIVFDFSRTLLTSLIHGIFNFFSIVFTDFSRLQFHLFFLILTKSLFSISVFGFYIVVFFSPLFSKLPFFFSQSGHSVEPSSEFSITSYVTAVYNHGFFQFQANVFSNISIFS